MTPAITRFREPRAKFAIAYSTKDRLEFTRETIGRLIGSADFDLYWFDGSATPEGKALPHEICAGQPGACELHQNVVGGPDSAIMYALRTLQPLRYELTILVENDILVADGWFEALLSSIASAERAGFRVGGASARVYAERVLSFNGDYCLLVNSGAACIALRPEAIAIVLDNYRTVDAREFLQRFRAVTGLDLSARVEFVEAQMLSCDFLFDLMLYLHGYVVTAPPVTYVTTIDGSDAPASATRHLVTKVADHDPSAHEQITRPTQIRDIGFPFFRFAPSRQSDRLLVACHQLALQVNGDDHSNPIWIKGAWRRRWLQSIGPFSLFGMGRIEIATYSSVVGLLVITGSAGVRLDVTTSSGCKARYDVPANNLADIALNEKDPDATHVAVDVGDHEVAIIGLTAGAEAIAYYAVKHPSLDHLPA